MEAIAEDVLANNRSADIIKNWLRNRYTIEFLGTWEVIHNPYSKVVEFDHFRMSAGLPSFVHSASEWGTWFWSNRLVLFEQCSRCQKKNESLIFIFENYAE